MHDVKGRSILARTWAPLGLAIVAIAAHLLLRWLANMPSPKGNITAALSHSFMGVLLHFGAYLLPLAFLLLAVITFYINLTRAPLERIREPLHRREPTYEQDSDDKPSSAGLPTGDDITLDLLRSLDWRRFEEACAEYFRCINFHAITQSHGADGGVDIQLAHIGEPGRIVGLVQCKQWAKPVGPKLMREFLGVMVDAKISEGIFITTSTFVPEARSFAAANKIDLIDGERLVELINDLPATSRERILAVATEGDYMTPTCVACGIKLVRRQGEAGAFWGCINFPRCRKTMEMASEA